MKVDSVSSKFNYIPVKPEKIHQSNTEANKKDITADQPVEQPTEPQEDLKGVLKLLSEGHFKGVADLRLRIVHDNKLEGIQLPEPSGDGKAYEKFMAIYNELKAVPTEEIPAEPTLPEEVPIAEPIEPLGEIEPMEIPVENQQPIINNEPIIPLDILA